MEFVRLDASGHLIVGSETPVPRRSPQSRSTSSAIAWNPLAAQWGIVWLEGDPVKGTTLSFARYGKDGKLVPDSFVAVRTDPELWLSPVGGSPLLWTGSGYAVAYSVGPFPTVELTELSGTGVATRRMTLDTSPNLPSDVAVAASAGGYGVAYSSVPDGHIHFARASGGAFVMGSELDLGPVGAPHASAPTVASDGTDYLVAWGQWQDDRMRSVVVARVAGGGALSWPAQAIPVKTSDWEPELSWNGCRFALPYQTSELLDKGARVTFFRDALPH